MSSNLEALKSIWQSLPTTEKKIPTLNRESLIQKISPITFNFQLCIDFETILQQYLSTSSWNYQSVFNLLDICIVAAIEFIKNEEAKHRKREEERRKQMNVKNDKNDKNDKNKRTKEIIFKPRPFIDYDWNIPSLIFRLLDTFSQHLEIDELPSIFEYCKERPIFYELAQRTEENHKIEWAILRFCNQLLRRMAGNNVLASGYFLTFMADLINIDSKSGTNYLLQFDTDNVTRMRLEENKDNSDNSNNSNDNNNNNNTFNYELYRAFWEIQNIFSDPRDMLHRRPQFEKFKSNVEKIIEHFQKFTVPKDQAQGHFKTRLNIFESYHCKFLTSPQLFHLQINDLTLRRNILVQTLIFLKSHLVKTEIGELNKGQLRMADSDRSWVEKQYHHIMTTLLPSIEPNGKAFCIFVKMILDGDQKWMQWKYAKKKCEPLQKLPLSQTSFRNYDDFNSNNNNFMFNEEQPKKRLRIDNKPTTSQHQDTLNEDDDVETIPNDISRLHSSSSDVDYNNNNFNNQHTQLSLGNKQLDDLWRVTPSCFKSSHNSKYLNDFKKHNYHHSSNNDFVNEENDFLQMRSQRELPINPEEGFEFLTKNVASIQDITNNKFNELELKYSKNDQNTKNELLFLDSQQTFETLRMLRDSDPYLFSQLCPSATNPKAEGLQTDFIRHALQFKKPHLFDDNFRRNMTEYDNFKENNNNHTTTTTVSTPIAVNNLPVVNNANDAANANTNSVTKRHSDVNVHKSNADNNVNHSGISNNFKSSSISTFTTGAKTITNNEDNNDSHHNSSKKTKFTSHNTTINNNNNNNHSHSHAHNSRNHNDSNNNNTNTTNNNNVDVNNSHNTVDDRKNRNIILHSSSSSTTSISISQTAIQNQSEIIENRKRKFNIIDDNKRHETRSQKVSVHHHNKRK